MPSQNLPLLRIGFIGGGQMTTALALGIIQNDILLTGSSIVVSDPYQSQLTKITNAYKSLNVHKIKFLTTTNNKQCIKDCNIVFIAVKPQYIEPVMTELKTCFTGNEIIVSIVAGIRLNILQTKLTNKSNHSIIRVMPNTPSLVGEAAIAITKGKYTTNNELNLIKILLESVGLVKIINDEHLLDAVTGVSGSCPAFVFMFIEAIADGGVKCGLSRNDALELAAQCVLGSAKMVLKTNKHPGELKDAVASPGGTTIAGIKALEKNAFRYAIIDAVETVFNRSIELGKLTKLKSRL